MTALVWMASVMTIHRGGATVHGHGYGTHVWQEGASERVSLAPGLASVWLCKLLTFWKKREPLDHMPLFGQSGVFC